MKHASPHQQHLVSDTAGISGGGQHIVDAHSSYGNLVAQY
jgi:hypothetical protein